MSILKMTALELGRKIRSGDITVPEATQAVLERIRTQEPAIHAYVTVDEEGALKRAAQVQARIQDRTLVSPLAGVPVACLLYTSPSPRD